MTVATYTLAETAATGSDRQVVIGVRAKSGSSTPSKASDWKGNAFPTMTFILPAGTTSATSTIETAGNSTVDGNREFELYLISQTPTGGSLSPAVFFGTITEDDVAPISITIDPSIRRSGQDYIFTARRAGDVSAAASRSIQIGPSTDYPPGSVAAEWPGGVFPTATATFAAGSSSTSFTITAPAVAQPE